MASISNSIYTPRVRELGSRPNLNATLEYEALFLLRHYDLAPMDRRSATEQYVAECLNTTGRGPQLIARILYEMDCEHVWKRDRHTSRPTAANSSAGSFDP
jgi:hypothetical protein